MAAVGIRELKNRLSQYLKRVRAGERVIVTERGKPVAIISPPPAGEADQHIEAMLREGAARWEGGNQRVLRARLESRGRRSLRQYLKTGDEALSGYQCPRQVVCERRGILYRPDSGRSGSTDLDLGNRVRRGARRIRQEAP